MDDILEVIIPIVIAIVWIGGAIVKKLGQAAQKQGMTSAPPRSGGDERESAIRATQDEVRAFLEQMGAAPPSPPPPPKPARATASAADALKAAAARRARRAKPTAPAPASAAAKPKPKRRRKRKPEKEDRLAAYRTKQPAAAVGGRDPITGLSGLPFMQRAVVLREILGPPPGLGSGGPLEREV